VSASDAKDQEIQDLVLISDAGERVVISTSPFGIGRSQSNDLTLLQADISGKHAEFVRKPGGWHVVDRGSTNGTFVNGRRVTDAAQLKHEDMVHLGANGFRVLVGFRGAAAETRATAVGLSQSADIQSAIDLMKVLSNRLTYPYFQPFVDLKSAQTIGWEALGRSQNRHGLGPGSLLEVAERFKKATALSDLFVEAGAGCVHCGHCWTQPGRMLLSFNIHPQQIADASAPYTEWSEDSVIRSRYRVLIEIPESLVGQAGQMARWVERIRGLGMLVAYDDFGKGQSRITDLLQVPPDYLKLDRSLIADLQDEPAKQTIVKAVVKACRSLQVKTIGEGVETEQEWQACLDAGIDIGQGYLFGKPLPAYQMLNTDTSTLPPHCPFVRLKLV